MKRNEVLRDGGRIVLFHRAWAEAVEGIRSGGFVDSTADYGTRTETTGVWLSNVLLDEGSGAFGDTALRVLLDLSLEELQQYEWVEEGKPYREWQIPAAHLRDHCVAVDPIDPDEAPTVFGFER